MGRVCAHDVGLQSPTDAFVDEVETKLGQEFGVSTGAAVVCCASPRLQFQPSYPAAPLLLAANDAKCGIGATVYRETVFTATTPVGPDGTIQHFVAPNSTLCAATERAAAHDSHRTAV